MESHPPRDESELEERLSRPPASVIEMFRERGGDLILLGAGGKMGPTLSRMARRAMDSAGRRQDRVIAVSRFRQPSVAAKLQADGIETIAADLLEESSWAALPSAPRVIVMTGFKFGASDMPSMTWAMNAWLPAMAARRFRDSEIAAFSSGNVFSPVDPKTGGCDESAPRLPVGEYGMSVLARERIYEYFASTQQTPTVLLRLNYAAELRYGVLVDLAQRVLQGVAVPIGMSYVNVIWQGDANATALLAMRRAAVPAVSVNIAGPEILNVADVARQFGLLFDREVRFVGDAQSTALLNDASESHLHLHRPEVAAATLIQWIADWLRRGQPTWDQPTHFEVTDGRY